MFGSTLDPKRCSWCNVTYSTRCILLYICVLLKKKKKKKKRTETVLCQTTLLTSFWLQFPKSDKTPGYLFNRLFIFFFFVFVLLLLFFVVFSLLFFSFFLFLLFFLDIPRESQLRAKSPFSPSKMNRTKLQQNNHSRKQCHASAKLTKGEKRKIILITNEKQLQ